MLQYILNSFFGCSHRRTTFPITPSRRNAVQAPGATLHNTYVVCLDCGKEFGYDWDEMRVGRPVNAPIPAGEVQPIYR